MNIGGVIFRTRREAGELAEDDPDRLREITVPVLFTCGRYDEATPGTTAFYQKRLPGSQLVVFDNASHSHHLEKEHEYLAKVRSFLAGT